MGTGTTGGVGGGGPGAHHTLGRSIRVWGREREAEGAGPANFHQRLQKGRFIEGPGSGGSMRGREGVRACRYRRSRSASSTRANRRVAQERGDPSQPGEDAPAAAELGEAREGAGRAQQESAALPVVPVPHVHKAAGIAGRQAVRPQEILGGRLLQTREMKALPGVVATGTEQPGCTGRTRRRRGARERVYPSSRAT